MKNCWIVAAVSFAAIGISHSLLSVFIVELPVWFLVFCSLILGILFGVVWYFIEVCLKTRHIVKSTGNKMYKLPGEY